LRKQTELSKRMTQEFAEKTIEQVYGGEGSFAPGFPDRWAPYHYDPLGLWRTWARALRETYEAANDARQTAVRTAQRTARDAQSRTAEETAKVVETTAPRNGGFPIADYGEKTVGEITDRLDALSDEQLRRVKDHEKRTKDRETFLQQIDRRIMRTS
jgi:hypothetical protein